MARPRTVGPTDKELCILKILWECGPSTVRQVHEHFDGSTGYTTTLKLMQIMAEKGLVWRDESAKTHIYHPKDQQEAIQTQIVGKILEHVFSGSAEKLVMHALSAKMVSTGELQRIKDFIENYEAHKP